MSISINLAALLERFFTERLMQQRLLQRVEGSEFFLVEGFETPGFATKHFERAG